MEYRRRRYFHFQHIPQPTHSRYPVPSFGFGALYNDHEIGKLPLRTCSVFLLEHVTVISYFACAELPTDPAMRFADLFLTRKLWKAEHIKPYLSDIAADTKDLDKLTQVCESPDGPGQRWLMVYGASPMSLKRDIVVPYSYALL
jgi:Sister chromatid cohesion protein Dcc1